MKGILPCLVVIVMSLVSIDGYPSTFYTDNEVGQTIPVGNLNRRQKKEMQQEILELMGLYSKPKHHAKEKEVQSATEFMRKLYQSLAGDDATSQEETDDSHIHIGGKINASALGLDPAKVDGCDVIISFGNKAKKIHHLRHEKERSFYFDFSEISVGEIMKGAELRLYKEVSENRHADSFIITVYRIKQGQDWEDKVLEEEVRQTVSWSEEGWLALDVTRAATEWTFFPHSNMGLYLKVTDVRGKEYEPHQVGLVTRQGSPRKLPFLVGYLQMSKELLSRRSRSVNSRRWAPASETRNDNPYTSRARSKRSYPHYVATSVCHRHSFYINFTDIGFDGEFLLAPKGYHAYYCAGACSFPLGIHMNSTNHAIVQTLVHLLKPGHVPEPCCAPSKFSGISLLYKDTHGSVQIRQFREMTVRSCGCH